MDSSKWKPTLAQDSNIKKNTEEKHNGNNDAMFLAKTIRVCDSHEVACKLTCHTWQINAATSLVATVDIFFKLKHDVNVTILTELSL